MMGSLRFYPQDQAFDTNLRTLRQAYLEDKPLAPEFLQIVIDGKAVVATTARTYSGNGFGYILKGELGEHRIKLDRVLVVEAYF